MRLFAQVQLVEQLFIAIGFRFAQIIEQAPALRDHLKQTAARRMIFPVGLEVLSQMLDPAGQKCDLHIRAAGIFVVQLELLETRCLVALCHNEGATLDEEPVLATTHHRQACDWRSILTPHAFRVCRRTRGAVGRASAPRAVRRRSHQRNCEEIA
jgi:hypothetical protein